MTSFGVSYFGNRFLTHAREDIKEIAACSDYIVHTVSESDLAYHQSVLSKIFADSRKAGLEVWADPWGLGGVFGGEAYSRFLVEHRDSWQTMSNGKIVPAACLNRPEWRDYMHEWILVVRDMGAQVVLWDEPHIMFDFESEWEGIFSCACNVCQKIFKKKYGSNLPAKMNESARQFRRDTMESFLSDGMAFAKSKGLKNALCLYAFKGHAEYDKIWEAAAGLKNLDIFGCDPYWRWRGHQDPAKHVAEFSRYVVDHATRHKRDSQVWIQAMRLQAGFENEITRAVEAAVKEGITHVAAWSFDGGELLDPVLSERPEHVWKAVAKVFAKFKS